jgi:hypothetical protein
MNAHTDIMNNLKAYEAEHEKFEKGNSAAGTRARKALAELAKSVKARRNEITETKNERLKEKAGSIKDHHDKVVPEKKAK